MSQNKQVVLPKIVGPYRHAAKTDKGLVFISGQIPISPETGDLVGEDIRAATRQVLENLSAALNSVDLELKHVVKTTIYLVDIQNFGVVNEVYASFFDEPYPARSCIQVVALPKNAVIEIDAIASW